jgi:hypothetical protein
MTHPEPIHPSDVFPTDTADWKQLLYQRRPLHHRSHLLCSFDLLVRALQDASLGLGLGSPLDVVSKRPDQPACDQAVG